MLDVAQHLDQTDLEAVLSLPGALADDEQVAVLLDDRRRGHPVERPETTGIVVYEERAVGLEHEEPNSFRETSRQAACVEDFAAGNDQAHRPRTVLSVSDNPSTSDSAGTPSALTS